MSHITKEEKAWVKKLQKVLNECPSSRLGFFTTGDKEVTVFDKDAWMASGFNDDDGVDPAPIITAEGMDLATLRFPSPVEGLCG